MLILENFNHSRIGILPYAQDIKRTRDTTGVDTLEFNYSMFLEEQGTQFPDEIAPNIKPQCFIQLADQEFVIKEVNPADDGLMSVVCSVNTEDLKSSYNNAFTRQNVPLSEIATNALAGTAWTFTSDVTKLRSLSMTNSTTLDILQKLADTYMCDLQFDALNKVVHFYQQMGASKGVYFNDKLNLIALNIKRDTNDFCTRLIPVGDNNLYITSINGGLPYVENYQYTSQVITEYWSAGQYTDANALKEDAIEKLKILSQPEVTFDVQVADLAKICQTNKYIPDYSELAYNIGDTITIKDTLKQVGQQARVVQMVEYLDAPEKNTVQLDTAYQTMEDLFVQSQHVADTVAAITTADGGSVNGDTVTSIDWTKVQNVQIVTAQIKDAQITTALIADATITTAKIGDLQVTNEKVNSLSANKLTAGTINANEIDVINIDAQNINTGTLNAEIVSVINLNASNITAGSMDATYITAGTITTDQIKAGTITATNIKTGTITADSGIIASINAQIISTGYLSSDRIQAGTIDATKLIANTITADQIHADSITATEMKTGTITAESGIIAEGAIGNANISDLSASKVDSGTLNTSLVDITSADGRMIIKDNSMLVYDYINNDLLQPFLRVQLGRIWDIQNDSLVPRTDIDGNSVYGLEIRDKDTQTVMIDGQGVHNAGLTDGAVDNVKVAPNANIDGAKLNINSVVNKLNEDGTESINGTKITVDDTTLDVKLTDIETNVTYKVDIISTNGNVFNTDDYATTLIARVYHGSVDVTDTIDSNRFRWTRKSDDASSDDIWNTSHFGGTKQIDLTKTDVMNRATFNCSILDENLN